MDAQKIIRLKLAVALALVFGIGALTARSACSYDLTPASRNHGFGASTAAVGVATSSGCNWTVVNNNSWITILSGASGSGSGTVTYALAGNPNPGTRTGVIRIAGQDFTVTQTGVTCTYSISPPDHDKCPSYTTGTVQISTQSPCSWTIVNTNDWILITSDTSGTGSSKVFYTVLSNATPATRIGVVLIAGQPFTIRQFPAGGIVCAQDKQVECGAAWTFDPPTITGNGVNVQIVSTITNFVCGNSFIAVRAWSATDACGSQMQCSQSVAVLDLTPPTVICPPNKSVGCGQPWNFDLPTGSDDCDNAPVLISILSTTTNVGPNNSFTATRTYRIADSCGNAVTCSQVVTFTNNSSFVFTCAADKQVDCGTAWNFDPPTVTGGSATVEVISTITNTVCGNSFIAVRTWSATDACGTQMQCSQSVAVLDLAPPTVICPPNKSVGCGQPWSFDLPTGTDDCDTAPVAISIVGTTTNAGPNNSFTATRTYRIADSCGNAVTCSQVVTFTNSSSFVFTCAADKQVDCGTAWNFDPPTVTGGSATVQIVSTTTNSLCGNSFIAVRTWSATDACGTQMQCSQSVAVLDLAPPTVICPPNKSVGCGQPWNFDLPTGSDDCDTAPVVISIVSTTTNVGPNNSFTATRTYRIADSCGNAVTCSQVVTFTNASFTVTCPPNRMVPCDALWNFDVPIVNSGCGAVITIISTTTNSGTCGGNYVATRVWQISDSINTSNCTQIVEVLDQTAPTITCPPDITVTDTNLAPHCPKTLTEFILGGGSASDNCGPVRYLCTEGPLQGGPCGGVILRTHIAYDACMNTNTCIQRIFVTGSNTVVSVSVAGAGGADPCLGGTLTFCVTNVTGVGPFFYAWLRDGIALPGETASCLTVSNLAAADVARYSVQVAGQCETVTQPLTIPGCGNFAPAIGGIQFVPAGVYLKIIGQPNSTYLILCGNDVNKKWNVIGAATTAANGVAEFIDKVSSKDPSRMYRLRVPEDQATP